MTGTCLSGGSVNKCMCGSVNEYWYECGSINECGSVNEWWMCGGSVNECGSVNDWWECERLVGMSVNK